jgi:hypothetical protein
MATVFQATKTIQTTSRIKRDPASAALYNCCQVLFFEPEILRTSAAAMKTHRSSRRRNFRCACWALPFMNVAHCRMGLLHMASAFRGHHLACAVVSLSQPCPVRHASCLPCRRADLPCAGEYILLSLSPRPILLKPLRLPAVPDPVAAPASFV